MARVRKPHSARFTTLLPPEVADTYRRAAELSGKSLSRVVREALEDHATATGAEAEIASQLEGSNPSAAVAAYFHLAQTIYEEAMRAITEAAVLDMDIAVVEMERMATQATKRKPTNAVPMIRAIRILAIDEHTPNTVSRSVALYDVQAEVDGQAYTFMVSITEIRSEDRPGLGLEFHDDHHERIFKWRSDLRTEIYQLVVAVFRKQEVTFPAHLGEPDIP